jgi:hypothetical protein
MLSILKTANEKASLVSAAACIKLQTAACRYTLYLLYWYTVYLLYLLYLLYLAQRHASNYRPPPAGTQFEFTCFTGKQFTCFTCFTCFT